MGAEGATSGFAYTLGFLLIKAGGALSDNMAWLFAIGAAVGLSDDHDGTAGLAGLVSFLMMQQLLSPGAVSYTHLSPPCGHPPAASSAPLA